MTDGLDRLTEKERAALRLLADGHDAKSSAAALGLSIHTVNERLREARRKLGVSSSRAAARALREAEAVAPELIGDAAIGDAPTRRALSSSGASTPAWRRGWIIGGTAMTIALAALGLFALDAQRHAPPPLPSVTTEESATIAAARAFLAHTDARDWDASWNATGQQFKALNTSAHWAKVAAGVSASMGRTLDRRFIGESYAPAPPYGYQIVKFATRFSIRGDAVETVSLVRENDEWRVVGIVID